MRERQGVASEKVQRLERIAAGIQERFGAGVLIYDLGMAGGPSVAAATSRLLAVLSGSPCAFLFLAARQRGDPAVSPYSSLRLGIEKERWLHRRADVRGWRARVSVLKNKLAPPGRPVSITIGVERDEL